MNFSYLFFFLTCTEFELDNPCLKQKADLVSVRNLFSKFCTSLHFLGIVVRKIGGLLLCLWLHANNLRQKKDWADLRTMIAQNEWFDHPFIMPVFYVVVAVVFFLSPFFASMKSKCLHFFPISIITNSYRRRRALPLFCFYFCKANLDVWPPNSQNAFGVQT